MLPWSPWPGCRLLHSVRNCTVCRVTGSGGPASGERLINAMKRFFFLIKEWNYRNAVFWRFYLPAHWQEKYRPFLLLVLNQRHCSPRFVQPPVHNAPERHSRADLSFEASSISKLMLNPFIFHQCLFLLDVHVIFRLFWPKHSAFSRSGSLMWLGQGEVGQRSCGTASVAFLLLAPFPPFLPWTHRPA